MNNDLTITITVGGAGAGATTATPAGGAVETEAPPPGDVGMPGGAETAAVAGGEEAPAPLSLAELGVAGESSDVDTAAPAPTLEDASRGAEADGGAEGPPPEDVGEPAKK